jgi:hypothetical protein
VAVGEVGVATQFELGVGDAAVGVTQMYFFPLISPFQLLLPRFRGAGGRVLRLALHVDQGGERFIETTRMTPSSSMT